MLIYRWWRKPPGRRWQPLPLPRARDRLPTDLKPLLFLPLSKAPVHLAPVCTTRQQRDQKHPSPCALTWPNNNNKRCPHAHGRLKRAYKNHDLVLIRVRRKAAEREREITVCVGRCNHSARVRASTGLHQRALAENGFTLKHVTQRQLHRQRRHRTGPPLSLSLLSLRTSRTNSSVAKTGKTFESFKADHAYITY